jgi:hypothetical protein
MSEYQVVTICNRFPTEPYYCLNEWAASLKGHEPLVISGIGSLYQGLGDKPKFVYRAIKKGLIKTKYIIFCDSWDLVFASPLDELIELFQIFKKPIVISSEKNCFPDDVRDEYDKLPFTSSYKYLNSGMIVGETEALLAVLEAMDAENIPNDYVMENGQNFHYNDQSLYQHIFLKQPVEMALDYDQLLCNTLHSVQMDELDFSGDRIYNRETHTFPCSFHMNGSAKTDGLRWPILSKLKLL